MSSYPLASAEIMSGCIASAKENGNGCTARPILYSAYFTEGRRTSTEQIDRDKLMFCMIPYAFRYGECLELYERAYKEKRVVSGNTFINALYYDYEKRIYFTEDSGMNIKITIPDDIRLMNVEPYSLMTEIAENSQPGAGGVTCAYLSAGLPWT